MSHVAAKKAWLSFVVAASCLAWSSCGEGGPGDGQADLNVALIVVDTLGAEYLGAYDPGGGAARTPNLDRLARAGVRFDRAIATAPWTQPSIASLFTSLMPTRHGVVKLNHSLSEGPVTLAEALKESGRRTHGVISHVLMLPDHGYAQGFDSYDVRGARGHDELSSQVVTDAAIEWLDQVGSERFFLFAHYFDPHYLYRHHAEFAHTTPYDGPVRASMPIWELRDMRTTLGAADIEHLVNLYREEVAYTDHHIGRLLDHMSEMGLDENTLVIFTADHGEEFMRHGWIGHTRTLFDELVRVPLIIRFPNAPAGGVVSTPVSLLDVAPTVLDMVGLAARSDWEGHSLRPLWEAPAGDEARARFVFSEVSYGPSKPATKKQAAEKQAHKTSLVYGDLKLIHDQLNGRWEFYDRSSDPFEQKDLAGTDPAGMAPLRKRLEAFEASLLDSAADTLSVEAGEAALEELRKLGYLR